MPRNVLIMSNSPGTLISASAFLFDIGVWLSSISGCASATYQAPRLIQSIAADRAIDHLDAVLVTVQEVCGMSDKPSPTAAKEALRRNGLGKLASRLGRASKHRNMEAHPDGGLVQDIQRATI